VKTNNPKPADRDAPDEQRKPIQVGGTRNEHGTRISRRIDCMRCGKSDHVSFSPKDRSKALCRACAEEVLNAYEVGVRAPKETRIIECCVCSTPFDLPVEVEDDGEMVCRNCLRGFMSWQSSLKTPIEDRGRSEARRSGTRIRKKS
jgi:formylmethanofuran dehydrogenase subunit E